MKEIIILLFFLSGTVFAQSGQHNRHWVFMDSIHVEFTASGPVVETDSLPFAHAAYRPTTYSNADGVLKVYASGNTIFNNDGVLLGGSPGVCCITNLLNCIILPFHSDTSKLHYFNSGIGCDYTQFMVPNYMSYNIIDLGGALDTVLFQQSFYPYYSYQTPLPSTMGIAAVQHGNGRDWWIVYKQNGGDTFRIYSIVDDTLQGPFFQSIGAFIGANYSTYCFGPDLITDLQFNKNGTKLGMITGSGLVQVCDFDRCTGLLSNAVRIDSFEIDTSIAPVGSIYSALSLQFAPRNNILYVVRSWNDTLYQYDLDNPNPLSTKYMVYSVPYDTTLNQMVAPFGAITLGPDGKIYAAKGGVICYDPTMPAPYDLGWYLGVINNPDSLGAACNFNPYGLYIGTNCNRQGLINYINYDLGPLVNSPCDTLTTTGLSEQSTNPQITLAPNPAQTQATLTWSGVTEGTFVLRDMLGRAVLSELLNAPNSTTRFDLSALPKGIYLWQVQSTTHTKNGKLVVE